MRRRRLPGRRRRWSYLRALYGELSAAGYGALVRFDLGMVHQIDYYTGVVFRGYVEGAGDAVLSGGRYDCAGGGIRPGGPGHRLCRGCGRGGPHPARGVPHPRWTLWSTTSPATLAKALEAVDSRPAGDL